MIDRMSIEQIAEHFEVTRRHACNMLVKKPDFPPPIQKLSQRTRFWSRAAVEAYRRNEQPSVRMSLDSTSVTVANLDDLKFSPESLSRIVARVLLELQREHRENVGQQ